MILKTGCNYDVHNKQYNPGLLFGDLGFHVSFLEVWLSNLWLNFEIIQANIRQLNERCSRTKLCLNFSYQRTYFEWIWWFPDMLCLAGLSSAFSRIVPWVQKVFTFFLIALSFLSRLSRNSFFMHRRRRVTYDQIPAVSVNENKHAHHLQTGLMRYMILKLYRNATRSSCDQRLFQVFCRRFAPRWHGLTANNQYR